MSFFFTFLIIWTSLHGCCFDIFSFFTHKKQNSFSCPHQCGEWGSKNILEMEREFIQLLHQADEISCFLSKYSKPNEPIIWRALPHSTLQDFHSRWHRETVQYVVEEDWIRLGICDLDNSNDLCKYYGGNYSHLWKIQSIEDDKKAYLGKVFTRHECTETSCFKTQYRFDYFFDFRQACFDLNQELIWLREDVHSLYSSSGKQEIRRISDAQYKKFSMGLEGLKRRYSKIFSSCLEEHQAPASFYYMALQYFETADHARGLQCIENIFDYIDLKALESHLSSEISFSQGMIQGEIALYDKALISLKKAINYDPNNKKAYFDQALILFEQGRFKESLQSYLSAKLPLKEVQVLYADFSSGLIKGIIDGVSYNLSNFTPSMCNSPYGLSHGLWAFAYSSKDVSQEMVQTAQLLAQFLSSQDGLKIFQTVIPELKNLANLEPIQKGQLIGMLIGKYGIEFLTLYHDDRALKIYRALRKANGSLTLQTLIQSEKAKILRGISEQWRKKTGPVFEEIKAGGSRAGDKLYKVFRRHLLSELQVRRILHQMGFKTFPKPNGIPDNSSIRISKKSGGMIYVKSGTTESQSLLVRIMPGNPKSPNPMQKKPYVIQRRGQQALSKNGKLVDPRSLEAHIPLEEFEFKGWE